MGPLEFFFVVFGPFLLFGYALFRLYFRNRFSVEPNNRQRVIVQNIATGELRVLGPGTWFLGPGWKKFAVVDLNKEPVSVPAEEVKTSDGIRLDIEYRFDMVSGRPFDPTTGQLLHPANIWTIDDEVVKLAVTRIDFEKREQRIREILKHRFEAELGRYTADELMTPQDAHGAAGFEVPPGSATFVHNTAELYQQLAVNITDGGNLDLVFVGINLLDLRITNLRYKDPKLQDALENKKRLEKLRDAALPLTQGPDGITLREGLAAGTDQYGTVVLGEAGRDAADDIGFGLANFGTGAQRPRRRGP